MKTKTLLGMEPATASSADWLGASVALWTLALVMGASVIALATLGQTYTDLFWFAIWAALMLILLFIFSSTQCIYWICHFERANATEEEIAKRKEKRPPKPKKKRQRRRRQKRQEEETPADGIVDGVATRINATATPDPRMVGAPDPAPAPAPGNDRRRRQGETIAANVYDTIEIVVEAGQDRLQALAAEAGRRGWQMIKDAATGDLALYDSRRRRVYATKFTRPNEWL